jgi:hypothetical protein
MTVGEILEQARALTQQERHELIQKLVTMGDELQSPKTYSLLEFEGIASHLADDEDPQTYVNKLRSEWDDRP